MRGTVGFRDLPVSCVVGVLSDERDREQELRVDLEIDYDVSRAIAEDDVAFALDYASVATYVADLLKEKRFGLLETAATGIGAGVCERFPGVLGVLVEVRKPGALTDGTVPFVRLRVVPKDFDDSVKKTP